MPYHLFTPHTTLHTFTLTPPLLSMETPHSSYPPSANPPDFSHPPDHHPSDSTDPPVAYPVETRHSALVKPPELSDPPVAYPVETQHSALVKPPEPSHPPVSKAVAVIGAQYCVPYVVDLTIVRKLLHITDGNFAVTDVKGNIMFKVKDILLSLHDRRVLRDAADNPIVSLRQKILSAHRRWQVFKGDSTEEKDLLFSVRKSSFFQLRTALDVFLANNTEEKECDFHIKGSWFERSCMIYAGDGSTNTIIAQMHKKHSVQSVVLGKDTFNVTVYPNVDYAFIVALVVMLDEINEDRAD